MKFIGGCILAAGLMLGANEGYWFPWCNLVGLVMIVGGYQIIKKGGARI